MKVVQINIFPNLSTGSIMMNIHNYLKDNGVDSYVVWGRGRNTNDESEIYMNDKIGVYSHILYTRFTDKTGFASKNATKKLIKKLEEIKPDIVHLHNIHGYYINIEILFEYLKNKNIKTVFTLHDCWTFTGHCAYFDYIGCNKWKSRCHNCPLIHDYPKSFVDNSKWNFKHKKQIFSDTDMYIVTPSVWLANLVKKSYLKGKKLTVINNGINTDIFKPTISNFRKNHDLENKKIILGVASTWDKRKGLNDFIELSKVIDNDTKIVLVGLNQKEIDSIPDNILGLPRTKSVNELVEIYSAADVLFNPTHEENYPTVNLEAQACGTPVITYNTGGSPETILTGNGLVVTYDDMVKNYKKYVNLKINSNNKIDNIENMSEKYYNLYKDILNK
ncbi:MAG: glycosyltransferase [Bacilli bacterium]|nr:glycosyltransferase [Bacilli bacterium]